MKRWFVQISAKIYGPLDVLEVQQWHSKSKDCLIWGKGLSEWLSFHDWEKSIVVSAEKEAGASLWQYRFGDQESKIYKLNELVDELKKLPSYDNVYVKSDQDPKWQLIFSAVTVAEKIGITRRMQMRVPIFGFFEGHNITLDEDFQAKLLTLSEGGFGLTNAFGLTIGHSLRGQIVSPNLTQTLPVVGDVVYSDNRGNIGIKFSSLSKESHSIILDYIAKFKENKI